ncbi:MAG: CHAT domain-containing protein, partial [Myxococcota bacterium]
GGGELTGRAWGVGGVVHRALALPAGVVDPARVATQLLGPLDEALDGAERIRVLSSGPGASIPVHALPWRGEPLILQRPVVYGLDLPTAGWTGTVARGGALILSDDEAGGAPAEALAVEELLASETRAVKRFDTSHGQAVQIREQLGLNEHFYYVGHGYYSDAPEARRLRLWPPYPGGAASEPSYLPLDGVSRLEVPDILMMPTAPRSVVLMACASGVTDDRTSRGGLSLAAAFLGAGTRVVIASTRVVESADAYVLGRGLHQRLGSEAETDPGQWMAHGLRWALDHGMRAEAIAHYRVYVP